MIYGYIVTGRSGNGGQISSTSFDGFKEAVEFYCEKYGRSDGKRIDGDIFLLTFNGPFRSLLSLGDMVSYAYAFGYENG